ncbi:hypothetical protein C5746_42545 [Streptomyces atratus]|uniref:Insertion element IS402-like domain-containing protein n=1 Tax=Streptomyces atratus TaxID=1893 RepID=A0A2Z5J622_STRAR|nr:hypothetical protein C5746_00695 [Streptomyces atratus]AXE82415.1 hypothetical protein C5746_42545 [Streptomyces atratus]
MGVGVVKREPYRLVRRPAQLGPQNPSALRGRALGVLLLQRHRQLDHLRRRARLGLARRGNQGVEPALAPLQDPAVQRVTADPRRRIVDAIFYVVRAGCAWRQLPRDFAPWQTVYWYFSWWHDDGTVRRIHDALRSQVREADGRHAEPSAGLIDPQSVRTADTVPAATRGFDAGTLVFRRSPHRMRTKTALADRSRVTVPYTYRLIRPLVRCRSHRTNGIPGSVFRWPRPGERPASSFHDTDARPEYRRTDGEAPCCRTCWDLPPKRQTPTAFWSRSPPPRPPDSPNSSAATSVRWWASSAGSKTGGSSRAASATPLGSSPPCRRRRCGRP